MKIVLYIISLFCVISCKSQAILSPNIVNDIQIKGDAHIADGKLLVFLKNNSNRNKYILFSYLNNRFTYNKNLYTVSHDTLIIDLTPRLKYLGTIKSDVLIVDESSIYKSKQAIFEFEKIDNDSKIKVELDLYKIKFLHKNKKLKHLKMIFAVYDNINLLSSKGAEYAKGIESNFKKQGESFKLVTIQVSKLFNDKPD